ncbi:ABC transporter substrate-binding protein [Brucella gallinifaecis]|uniref:Substrate-binding domain-containing protein n=1 Tax=Brucella gallinifaecis TaxID=215590 RepID=A0A502BPB1_9HYPH|nr:ABC transporter substrate-binding protein [Brucella gallinifaecis]TPF75048.1 substrate-binding domain-containing protein [Brucella gallinifaecis]
MKRLLLATASLLTFSISMASATELKSIGISLASLGNPFFVALASGAEAEAKKINPEVKVTTVGFEQDLNKQVDQIDSFIAAGVQMILLNPGDPSALAPAIKKAKDAGIIVVSVDTAAQGADLTVTTNNVQAGEVACQFIADKLNGKGNVIIQNGPQNSAIIDRVKGCKQVFSANPDIKILSDDQDGKSSRDGGLQVMQAQLTRFPNIDAVFAVADPQSIGSSLAMKQLGREGIIIASVDGAPDLEVELKNPANMSIQATASQDPYMMARTAVELGFKALNGEKPEQPIVLLDSKLVTRDNVDDYQGWEAKRD